VTREQHRTIQTLACLTLLHRRPPALSELGAVLGISKQAAFYRLHWLEKKGLWRRTDRALTAEGLSSALGLPPAGPIDARLEVEIQTGP
jgi:DNA-binding IclR family transcriptional regulator